MERLTVKLEEKLRELVLFLRVNTDIAEPEYVFWYLQFLYETGQMEQHQVQHTGIARFQYTKFAQSLEIPLLPLPEQKAIAI